MTAMMEQPSTARRPAEIGALRLRLKPAHRKCGFVQGAWWPRSLLLSAELPPLLTALASRFGTIERVRYHADDWSSTHTTHLGGEVVLDDSQDSPNLVSVSGPDLGDLTLLVVPPFTEATYAHEVVTTAASAHDSSTPEQLLGITGGSAR